MRPNKEKKCLVPRSKLFFSEALSFSVFNLRYYIVKNSRNLKNAYVLLRPGMSVQQ